MMQARDAVAGEGPRRRCLARRTSRVRSGMIRFVLGPDGALVPDVAGRMPGRGYWVTAERGAIEEALRRGQFSRQARRQVRVEADLVARVESLLARRCLDLLGLARRSGQLVTGFDAVYDVVRAKRPGVLVTAADAAPAGRDKLARLQRSGIHVVAFGREELGRHLGRDEVVHLFLEPGRLADRFVEEVRRLAGFREVTLPVDTHPRAREEGVVVET